MQITQYSQSSNATERIRKILVYVRNRIAEVENEIHKINVAMKSLLKSEGALKFGRTPAGGAEAGPFRSLCSCSGVKEVFGDAISSDPHPWLRKGQRERL